MTCRIEAGTLYKHSYNTENRLSKIEEYDGSDCGSPGTLQQSWEFTYDGDGNRVKEVYIIGGQTQYTRHLLGGGIYEFEDDGVDVTSRKYYSIGGEMVAMREWVNQGAATTTYLASDHLSSTSIVMDSSGSLLSENRYMPFGEARTISGTTSITETDFTYTGQRDYSSDFGLMDYKARFYSPILGRFTQPDSVVPEPGNPQAWNKYSYTINNPMMYTDPSGNVYRVRARGCKPGQGGACKDLADGEKEADPSLHVDALPCDPASPYACGAMGEGQELNFIDQSLENIQMALEIVTNPNASIEQRAYAIAYLGAWGIAAESLAAGVAVGAVAVGTAASIETGTALACADGDCTNETNYVYHVVENGVTKYVGITNNIVRRAAEHLGKSGWRIQPINGLSNLTRFQARAVEQVLIEKYGLGNLNNIINSISTSNPIYNEAINVGNQILNGLGY